MIILGIETSCDETAAAVLQKSGDRIKILSNVVTSSAKLQAKYGGIIPEQAAREQIRSIIPVIEEALNQAFPRSKSRLPRPCGTRNDVVGVDAVAVTYGPGLIGSLLVGVETAKTLATIWNIPLIPVNHLLGHFYANWISPSSVIATPDRIRGKQSSSEEYPTKITSSPTAPRNDVSNAPTFPCLGLLVSGGHTDLVLFQDHGKYKYLGGTRDDAAGECFDKCARLSGLPYPGGPAIAKLASKGDALRFNLPRPMIDSKDFDFSFSGLKTAVVNLLKTHPLVIPSETRNLPPSSTIRPGKIASSKTPRNDNKETTQDDKTLADLAASIEQAIVDVLVTKTILATQTFKVDQIMVAGGVAANQRLINDLRLRINDLKLKAKLHVPPPELCTDNAAMIASAAFFNYRPTNPLNLQANPNLSLS